MSAIAMIFAAACMCGVVPEHANDFFWENDKFGMRAYGPGDPHVWSGFDVFNKLDDARATCGWVLRNSAACGDWTRIPYEGILDNYTLGAGRGCGGIAMYADGEWKTFPNWKTCRIIENTPERCEFELVYPAFSAAGEMTCHITLEKGARFFKNTVTFEKEMRDFLAGPGIDVAATRGHVGMLWQDEAASIIALFEDPKSETEGATATAIFLDPAIAGTARILTDAQGCRVLATNRRSFTYYAGAAWSKAAEIVTPQQWRMALELHRSRVQK